LHNLEKMMESPEISFVFFCQVMHDKHCNLLRLLDLDVVVAIDVDVVAAFVDGDVDVVVCVLTFSFYEIRR